MEKPINNRMNSETVLDQVIFQLTPTRTRYELFAVASNVTEKLASGLLKPFLLHLQAAEEQLAKGGYSIKLQPPAGLKSSWFTKGTAERFVSFVNSPHVLERSNNIEVELLQLEEAIRVQTGFRLQAEHHFSNEGSLSFMQGENISCSSGKSRVISKTRQEATKDQRLATSSKKQLLRALEARRVVLQKEQGMSIARATAAGFELLHLLQLAMFADCFGGPRLIEACCKFALLCRRAHVTGFCVEYFNMMDQDVSWALSNAVCVSILKSLEADSVSKQRNEENTELPKLLVADNHVQKNLCLSNAVCRNEQSLSRHSQQLPSFHKNPGPPGQGFEWSTSTDAHQAFSAMHTNGIGLCPMAYGYNYEYSLGCQENFTASDLFLSAASQQSNETQANFKTFSSADMNAFPALRKLQIVQNGIRNGSGNSFSNGYEKVSDGVSDSSPISSSCSGAPVKNALSRQASPTPGKYRNSCKKILAREVRKNVDSSELSNPKGSDFSELSDSEMRMQRFNNLLSDEGPVFLKEGKQVSQRTVLDDDSVMLFEQSRGFALGMRSKKCLDFKDPEACCEQTDAGFKVVDDPFLDHSLPVSVSHTQKMRISLDSELQISQIYDKMSKQALKVNSAICTNVRHDPDDLLMLPKQQNHYVSRNSCDLLNADVELRGPAGQKSATLSNRQKVGPEPSQERVKKFLDQYNEKKQAKLRGNTSGLRKLNREGTPRALKEDKKRTELVKSRRSDGASPQVEAQIRAEKLRMYKAELQKKKKEKRKKGVGLKASGVNDKQGLLPEAISSAVHLV
ncbi:hypothetical protein KP509_27G030100 [Ceratopteris richardii]|uniref:Uncharacterized protein n=1 Tax=Ceratopteris richardii TaxID=49495 RepID=A0A8T2REY0_CERRI|nr:hypothetical protein KP509_27G030100 [Ceratopteris richardii]